MEDFYTVRNDGLFDASGRYAKDLCDIINVKQKYYVNVYKSIYSEGIRLGKAQMDLEKSKSAENGNGVGNFIKRIEIEV